MINIYILFVYKAETYQANTQTHAQFIYLQQKEADKKDGGNKNVRKAIKPAYCGEKKSCGLCKISVKSRLFSFLWLNQSARIYTHKKKCAAELGCLIEKDGCVVEKVIHSINNIRHTNTNTKIE